MAHYEIDGVPVVSVDTEAATVALAERKANRTGRAVSVTWHGAGGGVWPVQQVRPQDTRPNRKAVQVKLDAIQQIAEAEGVDWATAVQRWSERQGDGQA